MGFPGEEFGTGEWAGEEGRAEIDPSRMTGYGISIGDGQGTLWVDDIELVSAAEQPPVIAPAPAGEPGEEEGGEEGLRKEPQPEPSPPRGLGWFRRRDRCLFSFGHVSAPEGKRGS